MLTIHPVAAPPVSYGYTCGLVAELNPDVCLSDSKVNVTINPYLVTGENLTYRIEAVSNTNLTNSAEHDVSFLISNVKTSWSPNIEFESNPNNITIVGDSSEYNASIVYDLTTYAELPEEIGSRFQLDFFTSFTSPEIDVINITLAPEAVILLSIQIAFDVQCYGNYFDFRYGLDVLKFSYDFADFEARLNVSNTSLLVRTDFLNSNYRTVDVIGGSSVVEWSISDWAWCGGVNYPGLQFDDDVFNEYIGAQLWQTEYYPPTYDPTTYGSFFFAIGIVAIFIFGVAILRWRSKN